MSLTFEMKSLKCKNIDAFNLLVKLYSTDLTNQILTNFTVVQTLKKTQDTSDFMILGPHIRLILLS